MPKIYWSLLARDFIYNGPGDHTIEGEFSVAQFPSFPVRGPKFSVVTKWERDEPAKEFRFRSEVVSPSNQKIGESPEELFIFVGRFLISHITYDQLLFPEPGEYQIYFLIEDLLFHKHLLELRLSDANMTK